MSLREKILVILAIVVMLSVTVHHALIERVIEPSYSALERESALRDMARVVLAIERETEHLAAFVKDWAAWDDSYLFVQEREPAYVDANLGFTTFATNALNLIAYYDNAGQLVWGEAYDLDSEAPIAIPELLSTHLAPYHLLRNDESVSGLVKTAAGAAMVAVNPILTSNETGPARGILVMAQLLDGPRIAALAEQVRVPFTAWPIAGAAPRTPGQRPVTIELLDDDQLRIETTLPDLTGAPMLRVEAELPREITAIGRETTGFALASVFLGGIFFLLTTLFLLQFVVISPITKLTSWSLEIGAADSMKERIPVSQSDEIGVLSRGFNGMLERLSDATHRLQEKSYQSGMAAMAAGALHDVRNAIHPLTLQVGRLAQQLRGREDDTFSRAVSELGTDDTPAERKAKLADFLNLTQRQAHEQRDALAAELERLRRQVGHLDDILTIQDEICQTRPSLDAVSLEGVVADSLAGLPESLRDQAEIRIAPELARLSPVVGSRLGLVQVLSNLLRNALEAIAAEGRSDGQIEIGGACETVGDKTVVRLTVKDNGEGLAKEKLQEIFQQGYTTRNGKGRGAGLHWCSHLIASMHGRLTVESKGEGQGANFHLCLPSIAT
ncbi:MAG: CHASE4 domain-containing protein [Pseudomonadota bacterium]